MPTIAVDAMGGDHAPEEIVRGVAQVSRESDIQCLLVGDESARASHPGRHGVPAGAPDDRPRRQCDRHGRRRQGSDPREAGLVAPRRRRARGVRARRRDGQRREHGRVRARLREDFQAAARDPPHGAASVFPRQTEYPAQDPLGLLLDVGATVRCEADDLVQFARDGRSLREAHLEGAAARASGSSTWAPSRTKAATSSPRRTSVSRRIAERQLRRQRRRATISPRARPTSIVCEGLLGNVVLKLLEGISDLAVDGRESGVSREARAVDSASRCCRRGSGTSAISPTTKRTAARRSSASRTSSSRRTAARRRAAIANAVKVAAKAVRDAVPREIAEILATAR